MPGITALQFDAVRRSGCARVAVTSAAIKGSVFFVASRKGMA
jgi:hypothetical protein